MKPAPFEYHAPRTLEEATDLLAELGENAKLLAGGQSLIPLLAFRLTYFDHLIDLGRIEGFAGIERRNGSLWTGAGTTEAAVGADAQVATAVPLLSRATPFIGHFQIRNRGTIGGSLAHADPAAEYPTVALVLDAEFEVQSSRGSRVVPAADFFTGVWSTDMAGDEILTGISFPVWTGSCGFAIEEIARRHGDFAIAGAVVGIEVEGDRVRRAGIGLIGLGSTPLRAPAAEAEVLGKTVTYLDPHEIGQLAMSGLDNVPSDLHGSVDYRMHVGAVMVARLAISLPGGARCLN